MTAGKLISCGTCLFESANGRDYRMHNSVAKDKKIDFFSTEIHLINMLLPGTVFARESLRYVKTAHFCWFYRDVGLPGLV